MSEGELEEQVYDELERFYNKLIDLIVDKIIMTVDMGFPVTRLSRDVSVKTEGTPLMVRLLR